MSNQKTHFDVEKCLMLKSICQFRQEAGNARSDGGNVRHPHMESARALYDQTRDDNFSLGCNSASERGALIPPSAANQRPGTFNQDSHFLFISFAIHFSGCAPAPACPSLYLAAGVCAFVRRAPCAGVTYDYDYLHIARAQRRERGVARAIPGTRRQ
jgi:hypothetical protein